MPDIEGLEDEGSAQRFGLHHQAIEDYLKTIFQLAQSESPVSTSRLARVRAVKPASATGMIQRLAKLGLVAYEKHYGVTLTPSGEKIALEVLRHHRLIEAYLIEALGFSWDEVHEQADLLEHVISEKLEARIAQALGHPEFDPHGDPIPSADLQMTIVPTVALADVPAGHTVLISRIVGHEDGAMLRYLAEVGLTPQVEAKVVAVAPFEGPVTVQIGQAQQVIGRKLAQIVHVRILDQKESG